MQRDGEEVAVTPPSQVFAIALERFAIAEFLAIVVDPVKEVFVDSGLDVKDGESHQLGCSSSPSMIFAATALKAAVTGCAGFTATSGIALSPPSRSSRVIGSSPRKGTSRASASRAPPPWEKIS